MWYHRKIGGERRPIVDTWWQTETGGIMMAPLPGPSRPSPAVARDPARRRAGDRRHRPPAGARRPGRLADDHEALAGHAPRYLGRRGTVQESVLDRGARHSYLCGDNARCDKDGYYWIMGRIDDVLNVSGHRSRTIEIETALVSHERWRRRRRSADRTRSKARPVTAFVRLSGGCDPAEDTRQAFAYDVPKQLGAIAKLDEIHFTAKLPKNRWGKIMRRLLRSIAAGRQTSGDTSTLEDYSVLARLRTEDE